MSIKLTPSKLNLLRLPIVISELAWLQAVYIHDFLFLEVNQRLNVLLETTYREILNQPDDFQGDCIDYGLYRFEPHGKRTDRVWLDLRLNIVRREGDNTLLRITLPEEAGSA